MPFYPAHGTCDYCGCDIDNDDGYVSVVVKGPMSWQNNEHGVLFEYWSKGAYCEGCLDALATAIMKAIPVPERYEDSFRNKDKCIEFEKQLINRED